MTLFSKPTYVLPFIYFIINWLWKSISNLYPHTLDFSIFGAKFSQIIIDIRMINNGSGFSFRRQFRIKIESSITHSISTVNSVKCYILIEQWKTGGVFWCLENLENAWLYNCLADLVRFFVGKLFSHRHGWIVCFFLYHHNYEYMLK